MLDKETIQYEIGSALKSTKRPFVRLQVAISEQFRNKLIRRYDLNYSRFKACPNFISNLGVITEDIYSETENNEKNEVNLESLRIKLYKKKEITLRYKKAISTRNKTITYPFSFLVIEFFKKNNLNLNHRQLNFYADYAVAKK